MKNYRIGKVEFLINDDHIGNPTGSLERSDALARDVFRHIISKMINGKESLTTNSLLDLPINEIFIDNYQLLDIKERKQFERNTGTSIECPIEMTWIEDDENGNATLKKIDIARARLFNVVHEKRYDGSYCKYTNCSLHIPVLTNITIKSEDGGDEEI